MALDLLDTPARLTWDFAEAGNCDQGKLVSIADKIVDAGVFVVTLQGTPLLQDNLAEILKVLYGSQCLLTCHGSARELQNLEQLSGYNGALLLDITSLVSTGEGFNADSLISVVRGVRGCGYNPALSMTPLRYNLKDIPALLAFCNKHEIPKFKLPNAHIGDSFHGYSEKDLPDWKDLKEFSTLWADYESDYEVRPALEIHDLFLWEIMTPDQQQARNEYGGCQAANSLAHVDIHGSVYPCAAWPQRLGQLPDQSLDEIWASKARLAICEKIAVPPVGCNGCTDLKVCFGGCRGLAQKLNSAAGGRDLMCSGPR